MYVWYVGIKVYTQVDTSVEDMSTYMRIHTCVRKLDEGGAVPCFAGGGR